jgi:2-acylglycerol O-acyltransferase 2
MKSIGLLKNIFCSIVLGLLCGWYYLLMILFPFLIYYSILGNKYAILILTIFIVLTINPIKHEPIESFMYNPVWKILRDYFDYEIDCSSISGENKLDPNEKYLFTEFPHGIFPMGQFLSASLIRDIAPGQMICGTGWF